MGSTMTKEERVLIFRRDMLITARTLYKIEKSESADKSTKKLAATVRDMLSNLLFLVNDL